ncbi:DMT family transporter [Ruegeria sp. 2205SS24-7]|uniref:DMT family transporter n=1 Tax=Ruegeria discodermiae TaxID=3064389 RepID=UPI00274084F4|nr:DMT family transporter [Ruegeria sp. 2205SS24-7]MDP5217534.1 DMT family transporter [Ruegeria sp. 2205SS24-7]
METLAQSRPAAGIACIVVGMICISINDMIIKQLSGDYPLHQIVMFRASIGIMFTLVMVQYEGGFGILRTRQPLLHLLRGLMVVISNMSFFLALAVMPLADVTAMFFVAPLFITLLSVPILREKVGPLRTGAVLVGFVGVLIMQRPWESGEALVANRLVLLLPLIAALTYALLQVMTRKLGVTTKASALAFYIQLVFILVCLGFYLIAGDGRFAEGIEDPSLLFLFRAWVWPDDGDWIYLLLLGMNVAVIGYSLSQAYRLADAATVSPFEYVGLPMAVFWGWLIWAELPDLEVWIGMILIMGAGLFVFLREQQKSRRLARRRINVPR